MYILELDGEDVGGVGGVNGLVLAILEVRFGETDQLFFAMCKATLITAGALPIFHEGIAKRCPEELSRAS